jgi:mycothiol system anti-sigma-R factor
MNWMDELRRLIRRARQAEPHLVEPGDISCREAAERVFEWLDGELDPDMQDRVGTHLRECARCYPFLRFEEAFREAVQRAGAREAPTPESLEARVLGSLRDEGFGRDEGVGGDGEV